tara:strand:- start:326 stop:601 length:276 start_codon:yes stop_codon:yes gene_type:complete
MSYEDFNLEFIVEFILSFSVFILSITIPILFIFWLYKVLQKLPKIGNSWFIFNSKRRFFNNESIFSLDRIFKAINKEIEHKKKYYNKNKIF